MPTTVLQTSWNGGEVSRRMESRVDTKIYAIASAEMTNMIATVEGPAVKRPGFRYIRAAMASASWLIPFIFNRTQTYVLEFGDAALRLYTNGGRIENPDGTPVQVAIPYAATEAPAIQWQQSFDRLYLAHGAHPPAALTRTAATAFAHAPLLLENGPFKDRNADESVTVSISATTGITTITASAPVWSASHVGGLFRIEAVDFGDVKSWEPGYGMINIGDQTRYQGNVYKAVAVSGSKQRTGTVPPTHTEGAAWDGIGESLTDINDKQAGGILWQYVHDLFGIVRIDSFASPTEVTGTVLRTLADSLIGQPSYRWFQGAFSNAEGWPQSVTIWNSRLVFGKDFTIYGSVVGDYLNFADFTSSGQSAIDLSFRYTLSSSDPILWLASEKNLVLGTASAVYPVGAVNTQTAPGPGNLGVLRPLAYGATSARPQQIGSWIQFVQRGGRKIREGQYDFARDGYEAANSTVWCRHLTQGGITQLAYGQEPEELTWALRGDGAVLAHAFSPEQEVKGWTPLALGGGAKALSILAIPATDGNDDDLWLLVDRAGVREVWLLAEWWEENGDIRFACFVDGSISTVFPTPVTHLSGLQHLAGADVWCLADGAMFTGAVSPTGTFDLPRAKSVISIGLPYVARITTLRPVPTQGKLQIVKHLFLRLVDTLAIYAGGRDATMDPLFSRSPQDPMGGPLVMFNGDTDKMPLPGGYGRSGQVTMESRGPFPWIMTARLAEIEAGR